MTTQDYLQYHKEMTDKMREISKKKNHDYSGFGNDDPFANFRVIERQGVASTEIGFLVRISDKLSRINSFIKQGVCNVKDETIEDTLLDLANYAILMAGYLKEKKDGHKKDENPSADFDREATDCHRENVDRRGPTTYPQTKGSD